MSWPLPLDGLRLARTFHWALAMLQRYRHFYLRLCYANTGKHGFLERHTEYVIAFIPIVCHSLFEECIRLLIQSTSNHKSTPHTRGNNIVLTTQFYNRKFKRTEIILPLADAGTTACAQSWLMLPRACA